MAKGTANCICKTCGKTFEVVAYRQNSRMARQFEEWAEENIVECDACKAERIAAQRAEENAKAAEKVAERGWPELTGSEKQVAWATTIRENGMDELLKGIDKIRNSRHCDEEALKIGERAIEEMLSHTQASWWIDRRDGIENTFSMLCLMIRENPAKYAIRKQDEAELKDDAATVAEPEERKHEGIVEITVADDSVSAAYRKDDKFREIVKGLGYRWNGDKCAWIMRIGPKTGTSRERAAELGNKLLNAGFAIRIQDADILRDAVEGRYEPMGQRWVAKLGDSFALSWPWQDNLYSKAIRLPGAGWKEHSLIVPAREYEAVLDFAHTYGFRLTTGAQELVDEMRAATCTVTPAAAKNAKYDEHPLSEILDSSTEIINDLKD